MHGEQSYKDQAAEDGEGIEQREQTAPVIHVRIDGDAAHQIADGYAPQQGRQR